MTRKELIRDFLDEYYDHAGVDWRRALEGDAIELAVAATPDDGKVRSVTFLADGVRQVNPPQPFDSIRCARALKAAQAWKGR